MSVVTVCVWVTVCVFLLLSDQLHHAQDSDCFVYFSESPVEWHVYRTSQDRNSGSTGTKCCLLMFRSEFCEVSGKKWSNKNDVYYVITNCAWDCLRLLCSNLKLKEMYHVSTKTQVCRVRWQSQAGDWLILAEVDIGWSDIHRLEYIAANPPELFVIIRKWKLEYEFPNN